MIDNQIKVAIADDMHLMRVGLTKIITHYSPHQVVLDAPNGAELINNLGKLDKIPDVCLLDVNMPVMNGYDTMLALRALYPELRCLVVTSVETEFSVISMIRNGARGYIRSNSSPKELISAIESIHQSGYHYSDLASEGVFDVIEKIKMHHLHLTDKEQQFLILCCSELSFQEIADQMFVSIRTVHDYQKRLCDKLHVKNRMGLVLFVFSSGLLPPRTLY